MKRLFFVLTLMLFSCSLFAGRLSDELARKISQMKDFESVPVTVVLEPADYVADSLDELRRLPIPSRRERTIEFLKREANRSQQAVLGRLYYEEKNGKAINILPLWLGNQIAFTATKDVVISISQMPEVRWVLLDEPVPMLLDNMPPTNPFTIAAPDEIAWGVSQIGAPDVWSSGYNGTGVIAGVLDTGVRYTHYDLRDRMWHNPGETPDNGIDDDENGIIDDYYGYNSYNNDGDPWDDASGIWHGTHTAGTVAGDGTEGTQTGVAPGASIMAIKVLSNEGMGSYSALVNGLQYGVDNGANVFNLSIGFSGEARTEMLRDAMRYTFEQILAAGITASVSAGNGNNMGGHYSVPNDISSPADCPPPWYGSGGHTAVLAVGSTNSSDNWSYSSSYGPTEWDTEEYNDYPYTPGLKKPDIAAPGEDINSCYGGNDYSYTTMSGTSMSAPHLTGTIALMLSKNLGLTPEEIDSILELTALDIMSSGRDNLSGAGRVCADDAVDATPLATSPAVRFNNVAVYDTGGDGDHRLDAGETDELEVTLKNLGLPASSVNATLTSPSPYITITDGSSSYGSIGTGEMKSNSTDHFDITVSSTCPLGQEIEFILNITASGSYSTYDTFNLNVGTALRTFIDHDIGNVLYTVTNFGSFGFYDPVADPPQGTGFVYPAESETLNYLFGGYFFIGYEYENVVTGENGRESELVPTDLIHSSIPGISDQDYWTYFIDPDNQMEVYLHTYAWASAPNNDFVIMLFRLKNCSRSTISNFYTAYYADWDIHYEYSGGPVWYDKGRYDPTNEWAYMYDSDSPPDMPAYVGLAGLTPLARGSMVDNEEHVYPTGMGWVDTVKYNFMSGAFNITDAESDGKDWSMMLVSGPFTLAPDGETRVVYAILAGDNLTDFENNAEAARDAYTTYVLDVEEENLTPEKPALSVYPNPFNATVRISYRINRETPLELAIYNILGAKVKTLPVENSIGEHSVIWQPQDATSGIYFVRLRADGNVLTKKMVYLK